MEQKTDVDGTMLLGDGDHPSGQNISHQTDQPSLVMGVDSGTQAEKKLGSESMIKDGDTENFMKDVIEASDSVAVLVDFWAPWCGPCKTLGPILEKLVNQAGGLVKLVKINVDENQQLAAQMRVQSIPAVYAFQKGQPVDGFTGAVSESQIKAFFDKLLDGAVPPLEAAIRQGNAALEEGDGQSALSIFESIRDTDPNNPGAISGQIRSLVCLGQAEPISEIKKSLSNDLKSNPEISSALAAFELATLAVENQKE